ncbi:MAG TPA: hypothetical protein VKB39_09695, partial [Candidatus Baltobacteraceae bacterium]|nr:hypothetical protein [Candidatus Baltobacteraceae bacterium]
NARGNYWVVIGVGAPFTAKELIIVEWLAIGNEKDRSGLCNALRACWSSEIDRQAKRENAEQNEAGRSGHGRTSARSLRDGVLSRPCALVESKTRDSAAV